MQTQEESQRISAIQLMIMEQQPAPSAHDLKPGMQRKMQKMQAQTQAQVSRQTRQPRMHPSQGSD